MFTCSHLPTIFQVWQAMSSGTRRELLLHCTSLNSVEFKINTQKERSLFTFLSRCCAQRAFDPLRFPFSIYVSTIAIVVVVDDVGGGRLECVVCVGCSRWAWKRLNYVVAYDNELWLLSSAAEFSPIPRACRAKLGIYACDLADPSVAPSLEPSSPIPASQPSLRGRRRRVRRRR
uniref:Mono-/di-acylglycerol lipase N-terminal domain-containing protein n=1 Tax=Ananas comosus var. bracteatus TaxID=296719 RepID=A0A6V7PVA2_ANACO|nr:unnamed protein product [Ananas comosus var. bracteatus]